MRDPGRLAALAAEIRDCRACAEDFARTPTAHPPRPILRPSTTARLCIASQAPGWRAHRSGRPFDDPSGVRLRDWMGLDEETFWDDRRVAILPMAFCFPGHDGRAKGGGGGGGRSLGGDLPPPRRCAALWRDRLFEAHGAAPVDGGSGGFDLVLLVGGYAQAWHLGDAARRRSLAETAADWRAHLARGLFPMPHPSWRNTAWLKRHPWFEAEAVPELRRRVAALLAVSPVDAP
ncbi:MAG: uracil-DNA glycosylase family protein [Pseudomonadota bacterium]